MQFISNSNIWAEENEIDINFFELFTLPHIMISDPRIKNNFVNEYNPNKSDYYIDTSFKIPIFNVWSLKRLLEF